jgi:acyl carrier protein
MDRNRITEEAIEVFCHKLHSIPLPIDDPGFDHLQYPLLPDDVRDDKRKDTMAELDMAELTMDLEDAFGITLVDHRLGKDDLPTIGAVIELICKQLKEQEANLKKHA